MGTMQVTIVAIILLYALTQIFLSVLSNNKFQVKYDENMNQAHKENLQIMIAIKNQKLISLWLGVIMSSMIYLCVHIFCHVRHLLRYPHLEIRYDCL